MMPAASPATLDAKAEFQRLLRRNMTLADAAMHYGITPDEMGLALHYARLGKLVSKAGGKALSIAPPRLREIPDGRTFCGQCERRVKPEEARACASQWCKAKAA